MKADATPATAPSNLSPRTSAILTVVIDAIRPRRHGFDHPIDDDILRGIDESIPFLPPLTRRALPIGLFLLEWSPLVLAGRPTRLTRMSREEAARLLERCLESRLTPLRLLVYGLRALVFLVFYEHPAVVRSLEVGWERRLEETVRLRADTLDHAKYGYPR